MLRNEKIWEYCLTKEYKNYSILGRGLSLSLLNNFYDLSTVFDIEKYYSIRPSNLKLTKSKECILKSKLEINYKIYPRKLKYIESFLARLTIGENIFDIENRKNKRYNKYHIPYINSLIFSVYFIYKDSIDYYLHKGFVNKNYTFDEKNNVIYHEAMKNTINKVLSFLDMHYNEHNFQDHIFRVVQVYKVDKMFKFFKINRLAYRKNQILSDEVMQRISTNLNLKYRQILELERCFKEEIFYDKHFMKYCIDSDYPDPLFILYYVILSYSEFYCHIRKKDLLEDYVDSEKLNRNHILNEEVIFLTNDIQNVGQFLSFCKKKVKEYINSVIELQEDIINGSEDKKYLNSKFNHPDANNSELERKYVVDILGYNSHSTVVEKEEYKELFKNRIYEHINKLNDHHDITAFNFWEQYYFGDRELLKEYANSSDEEDDYMRFLFNQVIEILS